MLETRQFRTADASTDSSRAAEKPLSSVMPGGSGLAGRGRLRPQCGDHRKQFAGFKRFDQMVLETG
jgi:hypothetical protein